MTLRVWHPVDGNGTRFYRLSFKKKHHRDFSLAAARLSRNDKVKGALPDSSFRAPRFHPRTPLRFASGAVGDTGGTSLPTPLGRGLHKTGKGTIPS